MAVSSKSNSTNIETVQSSDDSETEFLKWLKHGQVGTEWKIRIRQQYDGELTTGFEVSIPNDWCTSII